MRAAAVTVAEGRHLRKLPTMTKMNRGSGPKAVEPHPDHAAYLRQWASLYEKRNYDTGLAGYFLRKSHQWSEADFGPGNHFARVLEVGAGTGMHLRFVRHSFDEYLMTDLNPPLIAQAELPGQTMLGRVRTAQEDATRLSFDDDSFDRVVAAHVLEHLSSPHDVLCEWVRVLKPGGVLSLVLPCDPGISWRMGRYLHARRKFIEAGLNYDYWMAREHINPINNLVAFVRHYFTDVHERWLPMRIPSIDLNLFYVAHIKV